MSGATPGWAHVRAMSDRYGTFEHAEGPEPRVEHGYCTDDVARVLLLAARERNPSPLTRQLRDDALRFVTDAQDPTGATRNRRSADGRWHGRHRVEDAWGRSLWALGVASRADGWVAQAALAAFERGAERRSRWPRSMAFAALGAAPVLGADPWNRPAHGLLDHAAMLLGGLRGDRRWPWPEARLSYANPVIPEAMIATGTALDRPELVHEGLALLDWLLRRETRDGHLSVSYVGGAGPDDPVQGFDQQPIEVAAMADACARAASVDGASQWLEGVRMAAAWFDGANDVGMPMWDRRTSGGYDGLMAGGVNLNQGAESTLALLSTFQQAERLQPVGV
jgi:hypothetical protein